MMLPRWAQAFTVKFGARICGVTVLSMVAFASGCGGAKVTISTSAFDFGDVAVNTRQHRVVVDIANGTAAAVSVNPALTGTIQSAVSRSGSCGDTIAPGGACSVVLTFSPTAAGGQSGALNLNLQGALVPEHQSVALAGTGVSLDEGQSLVTATGNPLVALYSYHPMSTGEVYVEFGPTTSYGLKTATYTIPSSGTASVYVAGMRANTQYHMRASVVQDDGSVLSDEDHTFTTSNFSASILPKVTVTKNGTPQAGIEMVDVTGGVTEGYLQAFATDLDGNLIWGYQYGDGDKNSIIQPIKLLPNGHLLMTVSYASQNLVNGPQTSELVDVREVDLAGAPVRNISVTDLNARLATKGFDLTIQDIHHDIAVLPNGHWVLLCNILQDVDGTGVVGDVVVDLDTDMNPVWVWNEFDHLDVNRRPVGFPDWTHSNAVLYTGDGNLLVSSRHQSWIMKVNYANGTGDGSILWKLGQDGDFKLTNGADPGDWFAGQHQPSFVGSSTYGVFSLAMMDNGFNREVSAGTYCGSGTACYTALPVMTIDETAKTATYSFRYVMPSSDYSYWGGGSTSLDNGDMEYDMASINDTDSMVMEVQPTGATSGNTVWQMYATGINMYRANRLPSLYPGVQW